MKIVCPHALAVLPLIATLGLLSSCGTLARMGTVKASQDVPEIVPSDQELDIGTVAMVVSSRGQPFVLIRTRLNLTLPEKARLLSLSPEGETATLQLSSEKRKDYVVADIIEGRAMMGDRVVLPYPGSESAHRMQPVETPLPAFTAQPEFVQENPDEGASRFLHDLPEWSEEPVTPHLGESRIRSTTLSLEPEEEIVPEQVWETPESETPFMRRLDADD